MYEDITAYVDWDGDLVTMDTAERVRRATPEEHRESRSAGPTGAIGARVARRTLITRCPHFVRQMERIGRW